MAQQPFFKPGFATEAGFIYIVTMVVLTSMAMLMMSLLQFFIMEIKTHKSQMLSHEDFYCLESVVKNLIPKRTSTCVVFEKNPNRLLHQVFKRQGCAYQYQGKRYEYLWGDAGQMHDSKSLKNKQQKDVHHFWLTVISPQQKAIQVRWVESDFDKQTPSQNGKGYQTGMMSWRLVS